MSIRHIAVIDVGKTNAKLAVVEARGLREVAVVSRPNKVLPGPPWPHFDLEGHWRFFLEHLTTFHAEHGIDAISVTTHGASGVLLSASGELAAPMLDYEYDGPDSLREAYDAIRPDFSVTGSPRLPLGLNLGAQIFWLFETHPHLRDKTAHLLTYPQYWGWLLTGELASEVTSLGCHTDLWNPWQGAFSPLVETLGLTGKIPPSRRSAKILGHLRPDIAIATGIPIDTPVACGIHDSNASLYPYLLGRKPPFSVVSTGTWVVSMAIGGRQVVLDPGRDVLVNVNAFGEAVPSARFMGGREFEIISAEGIATPTAVDPGRVISDGIAILPGVEPRSGLFAGRSVVWSGKPRSAGERMVALSYYLALMTHACLDLIGAEGPVLVEGPFTRNPEYLDMLASVCPAGVEISVSMTGTSGGAAMLLSTGNSDVHTHNWPQPENAESLREYAHMWRRHAPRVRAH